MADLNYAAFISTLVGVISIVLGFEISKRIAGKLKNFLLIFIATIFIFVIGEVIRLFEIFGPTIPGPGEGIIKIIMAFFFLLSILSVKRIIEHIHRLSEYEKKPKTKNRIKRENLLNKNKETYLDLTANYN